MACPRPTPVKLSSQQNIPVLQLRASKLWSSLHPVTLPSRSSSWNMSCSRPAPAIPICGTACCSQRAQADNTEHYPELSERALSRDNFVSAVMDCLQRPALSCSLDPRSMVMAQKFGSQPACLEVLVALASSSCTTSRTRNPGMTLQFGYKLSCQRRTVIKLRTTRNSQWFTQAVRTSMKPYLCMRACSVSRQIAASVDLCSFT